MTHKAILTYRRWFVPSIARNAAVEKLVAEVGVTLLRGKYLVPWHVHVYICTYISGGLYDIVHIVNSYVE